MKLYGIVNANNGKQYAAIAADSMENALEKFAAKLPAWSYDFRWMFAHIGAAPYIVTDKLVSFTAFEY